MGKARVTTINLQLLSLTLSLLAGVLNFALSSEETRFQAILGVFGLGFAPVQPRLALGLDLRFGVVGSARGIVSGVSSSALRVVVR